MSEPDGNPLPHPPGAVKLSWNLARNLHTILRNYGFLAEADELYTCIADAERAAKP